MMALGGDVGVVPLHTSNYLLVELRLHEDDERLHLALGILAGCLHLLYHLDVKLKKYE